MGVNGSTYLRRPCSFVGRFQYVTPMAERFFSLFDADDNGELDFTEFVMCTWNYLTLDQICLIDLGKFAHHILSSAPSLYVHLTRTAQASILSSWTHILNDAHVCALPAFQMYDFEESGSLDSFDVGKILMEVPIQRPPRFNMRTTHEHPSHCHTPQYPW